MIAIACDMPLVPAKFLRWLAEIEAPVAVCEVGGRLEPLLGRYAPEASAALADALADGAAMRDAVAALDPHVVHEREIARFGDPARIVFNVNSPEDLAAAERLLGRAKPSRAPGRAPRSVALHPLAAQFPSVADAYERGRPSTRPP